jgi:hypothetical protein
MKEETIEQVIFRRKMLAIRRKHKDNHDPEAAASDIDRAFEEQLITCGFGAGVRISKDIKVYR